VTGQPQLVYALLEIMPTEVMAAVRMPLNFSLVLDRSGSMKDEGKLDQLKQAVKYVIDLLADDDYVSVVAFSGEPHVVLPSTLMGKVRRKDLKRKIDKIGLKWTGTHIAVAVKAGRAEVEKRLAADRVNRILLLTDGQVQMLSGDHRRGEQECLKEAEKCGHEGIPVLALGLGSDWNEDLLADMARRSGGVADYIARPEDLTPFFVNTVQSMQAAVVQNAVLTLRLVSGINPRKVWRVVPLIADLGYSPISDRAITVLLGELEKGQGQALLVEFMLPARQAGTYRIAQAEIAYDVPLLNLVQEKVRADLMLSFTHDPNLARQVNPKVMNIVEKVMAFKLQTRALQEAELGNIVGATQKLRAAATILLNQGETDLARTARLEADRLEKQGQMTAEGKKTIKFKGKKTVRLA
ncbi:MAG TPA: VWA domain-containing protein, partial [Anaerolineae bacterium]|nr:VWA domain-containing protein [Anaerolineae bacterium]